MRPVHILKFSFSKTIFYRFCGTVTSLGAGTSGV